MLKHSKMDHAKQNMDQAKYDLRNFSRELNDVNMACDLHIDTGDFLSFADYFFDGFVVDWMVQGSNQYCKKTGRRSYSKNGKYRQSNYSVCKENGNESEVIRCRSCDLWIILIFLFQHLEVQD